MSDTVEFYLKGKPTPFLTVASAFQPNDGDMVSIKGVTYEVLGRSFSVDQSATPARAMRCNVIVKKARATDQPEAKHD